MAEYKKHVLGEGTKGITAGVVGALLLFIGQQWLNSDLEYKVATRDAYVSAPLGQQGLSMAFDGKPLTPSQIWWRVVRLISFVDATNTGAACARMYWATAKRHI